MNYTVIGTLFDDKTVTLDDATLKYGGAWYDTAIAYQSEMLRWFYETHRDAAPFTLFDVGASTGAYALLAAHLPQMRVFAFEPCEEVRLVLERNIALNRLGDRVFAYQTALADESGSQTFYKVLPESQMALSQLGGVPGLAKVYVQETVSALTLDEFVFDTLAGEVDALDVLKIDTEGGELAILRGAERTLATFHPLIICEYSNENAAQYGYSAEDIAGHLRDHGYQITYKGEDIVCQWQP